jgi:hypothetical protein
MPGGRRVKFFSRSFYFQKFIFFFKNFSIFCLFGLNLKITVRAANFGPHGNFGLFLASSVASVDESCTKK